MFFTNCLLPQHIISVFFSFPVLRFSGITVFRYYGFPVLRFSGITVFRYYGFLVLRFFGIYRYHGIPFHTGTESNTAIPVSNFNTVNPTILLEIETEKTIRYIFQLIFWFFSRNIGFLVF